MTKLFTQPGEIDKLYAENIEWDELFPKCMTPSKHPLCSGCSEEKNHKTFYPNGRSVIDTSKLYENKNALFSLKTIRAIHWVLWRLGFISRGLLGMPIGGQNFLPNGKKEVTINFADFGAFNAIRIGEKRIKLIGSGDVTPSKYPIYSYRVCNDEFGVGIFGYKTVTVFGMVQPGDVVEFDAASLAHFSYQPTIVKIIEQGNDYAIVELDQDPITMHKRSFYSGTLVEVPVKIWREAGDPPKWHKSIITTSLHTKKTCVNAIPLFNESNLEVGPGISGPDKNGRMWYCAKSYYAFIAGYEFDQESNEYRVKIEVKRPSKIEEFSVNCSNEECDCYEAMGDNFFSPDVHAGTILKNLTIMPDKGIEIPPGAQLAQDWIVQRIQEPSLYWLSCGHTFGANPIDQISTLFSRWICVGDDYGVDVDTSTLEIRGYCVDSYDALEKGIEDESSCGFLKGVLNLQQQSTICTRDDYQHIYGLDWRLGVNAVGLYCIPVGQGLSSRFVRRTGSIWLPKIVVGENAQYEYFDVSWTGDKMRVKIHPNTMTCDWREPRLIATRTVKAVQSVNVLSSGWIIAVLELEHDDHVTMYKQSDEWVEMVYKAGGGEGFPLPNHWRFVYAGDPHTYVGFATGGVRKDNVCKVVINNVEYFGHVIYAKPCAGAIDKPIEPIGPTSVNASPSVNDVLFKRDVVCIRIRNVTADSLVSKDIEFYDVGPILLIDSEIKVYEYDTNQSIYSGGGMNDIVSPFEFEINIESNAEFVCVEIK